jgi:hypothetical protein
MTVPPKLMMSAGIAVAGLGLIGAGAGATFTAQVAGSTSITTGSVALSLNGRSGSDLHLEIDGSDLGAHFSPITKELRLTNTGTLGIAATYVDLTATGCGGGNDAPLARSLRITLTDVTHGRQVYDGPLCSAAGDLPGAGSGGPQTTSTPGEPGPRPLGVGDSTVYDLVLQPIDADQGLPPAAQESQTSVKVVFTGYDS